jgi:TIR domain-containing protein
MTGGKLNISVTGGTVSIGQVVQGDAPTRRRHAGDFVFISHANEDKRRIGCVLDAFASAGIPYWIDRPEELHPSSAVKANGRIDFGVDWQQSIDAALSECTCVVAFWSRSAIEGERAMFRRELRVGMERRKLIQVLLDHTASDGRPLLEHIDGVLRSLQFADLSDGLPPELRAARLELLVQDVRRSVLHQ